MTATTPKGRTLSGRKVLAIFVGFFALVFAVDGIFAYFALASWPGLSQVDAYKTGLRYNQVLDSARQQAALGWTSEAELDSDGLLTVVVHDGQGQPIEGLEVSVTLARPVSETHDLVVTLDPIDGAYGARIAGPVAGRWLATVLVEHVDGTRYRMIHQLAVRP